MHFVNKLTKLMAMALLLVVAAHKGGAAADLSTVKVAWVGIMADPGQDRPFIDGPAPKDSGLAGLQLAMADNNSSGRFINQSFSLDSVMLPWGSDPLPALVKLAEGGTRFVVVDLPAATLAAAAADPRLSKLLLFNAGAPDDGLRGTACRANVLHTIPSRAMLTDALAQTLIKKDWRKWLLLTGAQAGDQAYAAAIRRSAKKFGAKIVAEHAWTFTRDSRHTAETELTALTQDAEYDVVVVADEADSFGDQLPFNTWKPRPVVGTQGLVAAGWHPAHEQWGAAQLQNRFRTQTARPMGPVDFAAWEAGRAVGEAALRTRSADPARLIAAIRADDFALAAFKGRSLNFRPWDGQLRQPILLAWARAVVSVAPQDGFLHPITDLDTLGLDKGESPCVMP